MIVKTPQLQVRDFRQIDACKTFIVAKWLGTCVESAGAQRSRMLEARRYQQVAINDWEFRTCAGSDQQVFAMCQSQASALQQAEFGWIGQLDATPTQLDQLARQTAGELLKRCSAPELPICCFSSSKGSLEHALENRSRFAACWPSSLAGQICADAKIATYIGHSSAAACSTGLYTLLDAADLLEAGHSSHAYCGAADASLAPLLLGAYRNLKVLAQEQPSAFSGLGSGFAPAEGAAFLAMHNDGPWRLIAGVRAADAQHITRCEDPSVLRACLDALWDAMPAPDLIVTHATGTKHGDAFESAALAQGPWQDAELLHCKPTIGHCLGASGIVELAIGLHSSAKRIWKLSLGFGGHIAAVALQRN